ncbi:MAG: hypothetical protein WCX90_04490 [Thiohalomonadaceae bacterium]
MKLFSRKKTTKDAAVEATSVEQPVKPVQGLNLRSLFIPLLLSSSIILLVLAVLVYLQFSLVGQERRDAIMHAHTERMADALAGQLSSYTDIIATIGRSQEINELVSTGDQARLNEQLGQLQTIFPSVLRVRFIALGDEQPDETTEPPLGYACLELVRLAEAGEEPPLEVHAGKSRHIDLLRPVVGADGQILGTVLVAMDAAILQSRVTSLLPSMGGYVELYQAVENKLLPLVSAGDKQLSERSSGHAVTVAGTVWQLRYWTPGSLAAVSVPEQLGLLTSFAIALLVLLLAVLGSGLIIGRVVRNDLVSIVKQAVEMWSGRRQHNFEVKLSESLDVLSTLEAHLAQQQPKDVVTNARQAELMQKQAKDKDVLVEELPEGEDLPSSLMFMNDSSMIVEELDEDDQQNHNHQEKP